MSLLLIELRKELKYLNHTTDGCSANLGVQTTGIIAIATMHALIVMQKYTNF